jgi:hypothetical protein
MQGSLAVLPCENAFARSIVNTLRAGVWVLLLLAEGLYGQQPQSPPKENMESLREPAEQGSAHAQNAGPGSGKRWDAESLRSLGVLGSQRSLIGRIKNRRIEFIPRDIGIEQFEDGSSLRSTARDELWAFSGSVEDSFAVQRTIFTHFKQMLPTALSMEKHSVEQDNLSELRHDVPKKRISFDLKLGGEEICRCSLTYSADKDSVYLASLRCIISYRNTAGELQIVEKRASEFTSERQMPFRFVGISSHDLTEVLEALSKINSHDSSAFEQAKIHSEADLNRLIQSAANEVRKKEPANPNPEGLKAEFARAIEKELLKAGSSVATSKLLSLSIANVWYGKDQ